MPRITVSYQQFLQLVSFLEPFEEATQVLHSDSINTLQAVPVLLGIDEVFLHNQTQFNMPKQQISLSLQERFQRVSTKPEYIIATLLDCRKKLTFFQESNISAAIAVESVTSRLTRPTFLKPHSRFDAKQNLAEKLDYMIQSRTQLAGQ